MRSIGLDVHRNFAQVAVVENGLCRDEGRIGVTPEALRAWADTLEPDDEVALEATGNSDAIACCSNRWCAGSWCRTRARPGPSPKPR